MHTVKTILRDLRADLNAHADPTHREGLRRFFAGSIKPLGVRSKELSAIISEYYREAAILPPTELLALCEELWASGVFEEPSVACKWCARALPLLGPEAFPAFEGWLFAHVNNWAHCDDLASHCIGGLLPRHPELLERTLPWLQSENRWLRRGAAVCLVTPAKRGLYAHHVFRVAENLLEDPDDMVRKGYGWMLKETSRAWPREVLEFVLQRRERMPRVALRYAIERLPEDWRRKAMCRHNAEK